MVRMEVAPVTGVTATRSLTLRDLPIHEYISATTSISTISVITSIIVISTITSIIVITGHITARS